MKTETKVTPKTLMDSPAAAYGLVEAESRSGVGRRPASTDVRSAPSLPGLEGNYSRMTEAGNAVRLGDSWIRGGLNE